MCFDKYKYVYLDSNFTAVSLNAQFKTRMHSKRLDYRVMVECVIFFTNSHNHVYLAQWLLLIEAEWRIYASVN